MVLLLDANTTQPSHADDRLPARSPRPSTTVSGMATTNKRRTKHPRDWLQRLVQKHNPTFDPPKSPILVLAPMVDQSDLPFRLLCRKYGTHVCFTPMIHSRLLCTCEEYRRKFLPLFAKHNSKTPTAAEDVSETDSGAVTSSFDRPLIAQLCGHDPDTVVQAARLLAPHCDGIDLNCGCPQGIAKRGKYGAFLLEQPDILLSVVQHLVESLDIPISVKVRLLPGDTRTEMIEKSLSLYQQLINDGGISMLTVHGRTRHNKGHLTGCADWDAIKTVVQHFANAIPIVANGGISSFDDAIQCWKETQVDAIMSSEAILEYPALFHPATADSTTLRPVELGRVKLAREYLQLAQQYPSDVGGQGSGLKCARMHIHRMLHADLQSMEELRQAVSDAPSLLELEDVLDTLEEYHRHIGHNATDEQLSWYVRHQQIVSINGRMVNLSEHKRQHESTVGGDLDLNDDDAQCLFTLFDDDNSDEQEE